jgi:hypothetical protein
VFEVVADRLTDIFSMMERHDREGANTLSLCSVAAEITGLSGAGIALASSVGGMTTLCTSGAVARSLMQLEMTLGDGPGVEAARTGIAVEESDLLRTVSTRWPLYSPEALAIGAKAVFGFPVRVGAVRFGALSLFRLSPGALTAAQASDAYIMASVIARAVLAMQGGAHQGDLLQELKGHPTLDFRVHQAAGMLAVQGSMSVRDALVALRAHAYSTGTELSALAERVVIRATCFEALTGEWIDRLSAQP